MQNRCDIPVLKAGTDHNVIQSCIATVTHLYTYSSEKLKYILTCSPKVGRGHRLVTEPVTNVIFNQDYL